MSGQKRLWDFFPSKSGNLGEVEVDEESDEDNTPQPSTSTSKACKRKYEEKRVRETIV